MKVLHLIRQKKALPINFNIVGAIKHSAQNVEVAQATAPTGMHTGVKVVNCDQPMSEKSLMMRYILNKLFKLFRRKPLVPPLGYRKLNPHVRLSDGVK